MRNAHGSASGLSALPNAALLRSLFINGISSRPWALSPAISLLVKSCQPKPAYLFNIAKNPVLAWLLKETVYKQFCAGEAPSEIKSTMRAMKEMGFKGTILTYAKETVFDHKNKEEFGLGMNMIPTNGASSTECPYITLWKQGTLDTVKLLGEQDQLTVKITGAGPRVTCALADDSQPPQQFLDAVDEIVRDCKARGAKILIDAESQRFQAGIMRIGLDLMRKYNRDGYAVVYNTYQAYLKSTPTSLTCHLASALDDSFTLGLKVVRGAYLATDERSLIHDTKEETDEAYDSIAAGALQQQLLGFGGDEDGRSFPNYTAREKSSGCLQYQSALHSFMACLTKSVLDCLL
ncbi:hypothetical protein ACQRIT_000830 [Beauveria bassiana]